MSACAPPSQEAPLATPVAGGRVRAIAFDLFTVFDPRGVEQRVSDLVGVPALALTWKTRLFEYCWLRAAAGRYADFERLTRDALDYAARAHAVTLSDAVRTRLLAAFTELPPWPDAAETLRELRARGYRLAPLANFAPGMIETLLRNAGLRSAFDAVISTDGARSYKPDPRAYALGEKVFGLPRAQIAFAAFGGWDAAGAAWFGYRTFWVNRLGVVPDVLAAEIATGLDLGALARWLGYTDRS